MARPHERLSADELLDLAVSGDESLVAEVLAELKHRTTRRAARVEQAVAEYLETLLEEAADSLLDVDDDEAIEPFINREFAFEHSAGEPRPDARLRETILELTDGGRAPFVIGITFKPSGRTWDYRKRGFSKMYVLCRSRYHGAARTLEKRLVRWAKRQGLAVQNTRNPPGRKAESFDTYKVYLIV